MHPARRSRSDYSLQTLAFSEPSFAALTGQTLATVDGPDSFNVMSALLDGRAGRDHLVEHGRGLALRQGNWKFLPAQGNDSGKDIGESSNIAGRHPEIVAKMGKLLNELQAAGRSRP